MKIAGFLCVALAGIATVVDQVTAQEASRQYNSEKAAIKFKPMLNISNGRCVPYPAVSKDGSYVEGFFEHSKSANYCKGNQHGSQIYGRATWYNEIYVIVYTWYFLNEWATSRQGWQTCALWVDNPDNVSPNILAVSVSSPNRRFTKHLYPKPPTVDGTNVKLRYFLNDWAMPLFEVEITDLKGGFQDLIMWQQLTEEARCALNQTSYGNRQMPINENNFWTTLEEAYPSE
ncbi:unnamed protein product [Peronospora farinosa]|uniref:Uncharacterized protein n=1 Tax=Peronospora farinosa TaxID=134698 RepID=A0AAV0UMW4_9STRA|nr:unnamed protein product [Peronospora farinosa]